MDDQKLKDMMYTLWIQKSLVEKLQSSLDYYHGEDKGQYEMILENITSIIAEIEKQVNADGKTIVISDIDKPSLMMLLLAMATHTIALRTFVSRNFESFQQALDDAGVSIDEFYVMQNPPNQNIH